MILEELKQLLMDQFDIDPEEITEDTAFEDDLDADSLDMVELALACEDEFDISLEEDELVPIQTVGELARYLENKAEE